MGSLIEKIDAWLARSGWTQAALERKAGLPENRISKWRETGEPTLRQGLRIAQVMGVDMSFLADDDANEPPPAPVELGVDEQAALELFRDLRAVVGRSSALKEMAKLAACGPATAHPEPAKPEPPHGPATFLGRANLTEADANRQREANRPKKAPAKPRAKAKDGGGGVVGR